MSCFLFACCPLVVLAAGIATTPTRGQVSEFDVKVAFIYNFTKFITWPGAPVDGADRPFSICTYGPGRLDPLLDGLTGKSAQNHQIEIIHKANADRVGSCNILVVGDVSKSELKALLASVARKPVLTIGDQSEFVAQGGMIGFAVLDERVRFSINVAAAEDAGLSISSQLLKLAIKVD